MAIGYDDEGIFRWTKRIEKALQKVKKEMCKLPMLVISKEDKTLMVCLLLKSETINAMLLTRRNELRFQFIMTHEVKVILDDPIENILRNSGISGQLALWAVELGTYHISILKEAAEGQVVTEFLAEEDKSQENRRKALRRPLEHWGVYGKADPRTKGMETSLVALDLGSTRFYRKVENGVEGVEATGIDTIEATKKQHDVILIHGGDDYINSLDYDSWIEEWNLL
ncbi:hypothetical protein Tco_0152973 [Tanacetum coccineum]